LISRRFLTIRFGDLVGIGEFSESIGNGEQFFIEIPAKISSFKEFEKNPKLLCAERFTILD